MKFPARALNIDTPPSSAEDSRLRLAYLQAVVSSLPQGISVFDEHLQLRVWNRGFIELLDLPPPLVREGAHFSDIIRIPAQRGEYGPGDAEEHVKRITEQASQFSPHRFERTRPDGRTRLVDSEPLLINGKLAGFITTYTDITERKQAEEELRHQHALLETVVEAIPSAVTMFDKNLDLLLHNREFQRLLDLPDSLFAEPPVPIERIYRFNAERANTAPASRNQSSAR